VTRREMFAGAVALPGALAMAGEAEAAESTLGFTIGVCSYSFREFQRTLAIDMMKQMSVSVVSVKDVHLHYGLSRADLQKGADEFRKAGFTIESAGNTDLKSDDAGELRRYFEYARACGIPMLVAATTHAALPKVERLVREFDIKVAIHNHGPEDKEFPLPKTVVAAVKGMDPRVGLCMDVGHTMRGGADVVAEIANAGARLLEMHMKDLKSTTKSSWCQVGDGMMPVVEIFKELRRIGYRGSVDLECEANSENPLPEAQHSIGYLKGVAAGLRG